jgi:hypothetical protein
VPTYLAAPHVRHAAARLMRLQPASEHPAERPGPLPPGHGRDRPSPGPGPAGVARRSPTGRGRPRHPARATCRDSRRRGRPPRRRMEPRDRARRRSHRGLGEMLRIRRVAADDLDLGGLPRRRGFRCRGPCCLHQRSSRVSRRSLLRELSSAPIALPASIFTNRTARSPWRRSAAPVQPPTWQVVQPTTRSRNEPRSWCRLTTTRRSPTRMISNGSGAVIA